MRRVAHIDKRTKAMLLCGTVACPLFLSAVLVEGAIRPNYSSFLFPLSSLSFGSHAGLQIANFVVTGMLLILFSIGLRRMFNAWKIKFKGPLLITVVGVGLIGAGIFVTDPLFGYPGDKPLVLRQYTLHGHLHDAFSMLVFIGLPRACFTFRKRFKAAGRHGWAAYATFTGYAMIIAFVLASMGFRQVSGFKQVAGLSQRLCMAIGLTWISVMSVQLSHAPILQKPK